MTPRTIAIDFDGVLSDYRGWTGQVPTDPPVRGTREAVTRIRELGYRVAVFSCRALTVAGREGIAAWLTEHDITVDEITAIKPHAVLYLDDRAERFVGCWDRVLAIIETASFAPWNSGRARPAEEIAPFITTCGTCGGQPGEVRPDGTYSACGHPIPERPIPERLP